MVEAANPDDRTRPQDSAELAPCDELAAEDSRLSVEVVPTDSGVSQQEACGVVLGSLRNPGPQDQIHRGIGSPDGWLCLPGSSRYDAASSFSCSPEDLPDIEIIAHYGVPDPPGEALGSGVAYEAGEYPFFGSPTGNINCAMTAEQARCDIAEHTYRPPPRPDSCAYDWGTSIIVAEGRGRFACISDSVLPPGDRPILEYGQASRVGPFRCTSSEDGMTCENTETGHGFFLSQQRAEAY